MINFLKNCFLWALDVAAVVFTVVPESVFGNYKLFEKWSKDTNIILNRVLTIFAIFFAVMAVYSIGLWLQRWKTIKGKNYSIRIEYGNLFKKKGKKVIPFDECFTTNIGEDAPYIKPSSVCGQFLKKHSADDIQQKIESANLRETKEPLNNSAYCGSGVRLCAF